MSQCKLCAHAMAKIEVAGVSASMWEFPQDYECAFGHDDYPGATDCADANTDLVAVVSGSCTACVFCVVKQSGRTVDEWVFPDEYCCSAGCLHFPDASKCTSGPVL